VTDAIRKARKNYSLSREFCLIDSAMFPLKLQPAHFGGAHFICNEGKRGEVEVNIKFL
jgi:hypothetical protein